MQFLRLFVITLVVLLPTPARAQSVKLADLVGTWVGGNPAWYIFRSQQYAIDRDHAVALREADIAAGKITADAVVNAFHDSTLKALTESIVKAGRDTLVIWPDSLRTMWSQTKQRFDILPGDTLVLARSKNSPDYTVVAFEDQRLLWTELDVSPAGRGQVTKSSARGTFVFRRLDSIPKP